MLEIKKITYPTLVGVSIKLFAGLIVISHELLWGI